MNMDKEEHFMYKTTPALRASQKRYNDKKRARYRAQPAEYRERFNWLGQPRTSLGKEKLEISKLVRNTTKYRTLGEVRSAVQRGEIIWESLPPRLQQKIPMNTGRGPATLWRHKIQYGESLNQMGRRLGISREAVRIRIRRWGTPEPLAGDRHRANSRSFISPRKLYVWGYQSLEQLAQEPDHKLLRLTGMGPKKLAQLRTHFLSVDTNHTEAQR